MGRGRGRTWIDCVNSHAIGTYTPYPSLSPCSHTPPVSNLHMATPPLRPHAHTYMYKYTIGLTLRGISARPTTGYLTHLETLRYVQVILDQQIDMDGLT